MSRPKLKLAATFAHGHSGCNCLEFGCEIVYFLVGKRCFYGMSRIMFNKVYFIMVSIVLHYVISQNLYYFILSFVTTHI